MSRLSHSESTWFIASAGGAGTLRGAMRVTLWGILAMGATAIMGTLFGVAAG